jgi:hypothetical protein
MSFAASTQKSIQNEYSPTPFASGGKPQSASRNRCSANRCAFCTGALELRRGCFATLLLARNVRPANRCPFSTGAFGTSQG